MGTADIIAGYRTVLLDKRPYLLSIRKKRKTCCSVHSVTTTVSSISSRLFRHETYGGGGTRSVVVTRLRYGFPCSDLSRRLVTITWRQIAVRCILVSSKVAAIVPNWISTTVTVVGGKRKFFFIRLSKTLVRIRSIHFFGQFYSKFLLYEIYLCVWGCFELSKITLFCWTHLMKSSSCVRENSPRGSHLKDVITK